MNQISALFRGTSFLPINESMVLFLIIWGGLAFADSSQPETKDEEYKSYWKSFKLDIRPPVDERLFLDFQNSFLHSSVPPSLAIETDQIVQGECISRLDPESKIRASAGVIVENDPILGRKIYLRQLFHWDEKEEMQDDVLRKAHLMDRATINSLTMFRPLMPGPYSEETIISLSDALLFSAKTFTNPITREIDAAPQHFMVRSERPNFFRSLFGVQIGTLWVVQLCAERGGCFCPVGKCYGSAPTGTPVTVCGYDMVHPVEDDE